MKSLGYPERDCYELTASPHRFPDGAHYRNEVAGIENFQVLEAMVDEAEKRQVPIHRIIATVGGATLLTDAELKDMAQLAAAKNIEVIITPCTSRGWDSGRQITTPEGIVSGMRIRGVDNMYYVLKCVERSLEAGFKGFLVTDEGLLTVLGEMRAKGYIPQDVIFKVSVFAGHGTPASAKLLQKLGADTFNPLADLTLPMLAAIRSAVNLPMDVYLALVDGMGGFYRFSEAAEIAKICAPVYFKFEPGKSEGDIYKTWVDTGYKAYLAREKVRQVQAVSDWIKRLAPELVCSAQAVAGLSIPKA
ncbi:hypothetical protein [Sporomusa sp. KB1]|uniref:hypothetical protein n=1 Tax=Sporomusa sp. KB1 TaxID=943346 RepID=UPI0011A98DEB|nr:hypothetical protein [Sporomusa sp. KB1]